MLHNYTEIEKQEAITNRHPDADFVIYFSSANRFISYRETGTNYEVEMYNTDKKEWVGTDWKSYDIKFAKVNFTVVRELVWEK